MIILFFKAARASESEQELPVDKMRRILQSHVDESKTEEDREDAEQALRAFNQAT